MEKVGCRPEGLQTREDMLNGIAAYVSLYGNFGECVLSSNIFFQVLGLCQKFQKSWAANFTVGRIAISIMGLRGAVGEYSDSWNVDRISWPELRLEESK